MSIGALVNPVTLNYILKAMEVGTAIAGGFIKDEKVKGYINIGAQAIGGSAAHVAAQAQIQEWLAAGHTPTEEELEAALAEASKAHADLQGSVKDFLNKGNNGGKAS